MNPFGATNAVHDADAQRERCLGAFALRAAAAVLLVDPDRAPAVLVAVLVQRVLLICLLGLGLGLACGYG